MAGKTEEITKEYMDSIDSENIFLDIFVKCDNENEGHVEVSSLIKFIAPFIDSNEEHLFELRKILDPMDINPIISYDLFSNAMKIWTTKCKSNLQTSFASNEKSITNKRLSDHGMRQSTPNKETIQKNENKIDFDCGLNLSNISSYSYAGSVQSACDPVILNEQINELQHQNKKLTDLLSEVREQLAISEEVNNNMQNDLDKLKKNRLTDQKVIEDLQKVRTELEKEREENSILIKNHNSIIQSLNFYKKENSQLRKNMLDFETENQKNQEIIISLRNKETKQSAKIDTYRNEIQIKNNDIISFQEKIGEINIVCSEKDSYIKEVTEELRNLRSDNNSLQKCLDDLANKNSSIKSDLMTCESETNPEKRPCVSLGPEVAFGDECFQDTPNSCRSSSPLSHESLQTELIRASNTECFGSHTICEHKLQLIQCEEENESLNDKIRKYTEEIDNMKINISEINNFNTKLQDQILLLTESQESNNEETQDKVEKYTQLQKDNEEISKLNDKLKSDLASLKSENRRYARLQQKIKKLEEEIFEEKTKSERLLMQKNSLQSKTEEISLALEQSKHDLQQLVEKSNIRELEKKNQLLMDSIAKEENNVKELQLNIKKLFAKIGVLEQTKQMLEEKLSKEENNSKVLKLNINKLEEKFLKEENNAKELKTELNININHLSTKINILEQTKLELFKEKNNVKELKLELNELTSKIQEYNSKEHEIIQLKRKINDWTVKMEIFEQTKNQLEEQLVKQETTTTELQLKISDLSLIAENLDETKRHLEDKLSNEENKFKNVSVLLNEMRTKNEELESQKDVNLSKIKKLILNIENLEKKIQNFRKSNIDLNTAKHELENSLAVITNQRNSLLSHINFTKQQIKECIDLLGKNTLLVTRVWKTDLETVILEDLTVSDLTDDSSLSGVMRMTVGNLTEDIKDLKNQTRLSGILLQSLAKIKQNETLEEDESLLSAVFSPDSRPPVVTQSTFCSNSEGFSLYLFNSSDSSPTLWPQMSPECTQPEMTEEESHFTCVEVTDPGVSVGSPAGSVFIAETSDGPQNGEEHVNGHVVEEAASGTGNKAQRAPLKQYRSMSEGTTIPQLFTDDGDIMLFPSLQDIALVSLGLQNGEQSRERASERLSEEEIEAKFHTLALIFTIDSKSLAQRRELQRRQRNQADDNLAAEVTRLQHGIQRLAPLCVDAETTELVTALLTRLNIIVKAAQRMSTCTQVYGGVLQEYRVASAVNLMLVHLRNIQQQRDAARRQLQLTKKMLQENTCAVGENNAVAVGATSRRLSTTANGRVVTRRRASIANIPRPLDSPSAGVAKRAVRRISADAYSEHSTRPWDCDRPPLGWMPLERPATSRLSRPSRIELNLDLSKIHECSVESIVNNNEESDSDITAYETPTAVFPTPNLLMQQPTVREPKTFSDHAIEALTSNLRLIAYCWNRWMKNGTTREIIFYVMILFFALVSIIILNIMIVSKFTRQGAIVQRIPWSWMTWDEFWRLIVDVRNTGQRPY